MTSYILDSNILLRYLCNDIIAQAQQAETLFRSVYKHECFLEITAVGIVETAFVLLKVYKQDKHAISKQLLVFIDNPNIDIDERTVLHQAFVHWELSSISLIDSYILCRAQSAGKSVFTFDKKLAAAARKK